MSDTLRSFPEGTQTTHWPDCWQEHRACTLARVEQLERQRQIHDEAYGLLMQAYDASRVQLAERDAKISQLREVLALLNSMILSGEQHSERSREAVNNALHQI